LASAILDGEPIDWAQAESSANGDERRVLTELRFLSTIVDLHRQLPHDAASEHERGDSIALTASGAQRGRLRLIEKLCAGTFETVYRAWDPRLQREVAIEMLVLPADAGDGFAADIIHERRRLARVRPPSMMTIHDAEQIGNVVAPDDAAPGYRRAFVQIAAVVLVVVAMTAAALSLARGRTPEAAAQPLRIAVLPFSMDGGGDDQDRLRDGITEDVSTRLARFDNVRVISRASTGSVSVLKLTMEEIGARLEVDVIVAGRLRIANDNVTVATNVIRASDGRVLWTAEFVRPTAGRLALQQDLAEAIADTLNLRHKHRSEVAGAQPSGVRDTMTR
jgi:TolB-like protein